MEEEKLKTLKEIRGIDYEEFDAYNELVHCKDLRAEAVKWWHIAKLAGDKSTCFFIQNFFNLTEEYFNGEA